MTKKKKKNQKNKNKMKKMKKIRMKRGVEENKLERRKEKKL